MLEVKGDNSGLTDVPSAHNRGDNQRPSTPKIMDHAGVSSEHSSPFSAPHVENHPPPQHSQPSPSSSLLPPPSSSSSLLSKTVDSMAHAPNHVKSNGGAGNHPPTPQPDAVSAPSHPTAAAEEEEAGEHDSSRNQDSDAIAAAEELRRWTKIFVGGLPFTSTDQALSKYFSQFGEITEAVVIRDRRSGASKGYGFVTMKEKGDAEKAVGNQYPVIDGRRCNINFAFKGAKARGDDRIRDYSFAPKHPEHINRYFSACHDRFPVINSHTNYWNQLQYLPSPYYYSSFPTQRHQRRSHTVYQSCATIDPYCSNVVSNPSNTTRASPPYLSGYRVSYPYAYDYGLTHHGFAQPWNYAYTYPTSPTMPQFYYSTNPYAPSTETLATTNTTTTTTIVSSCNTASSAPCSVDPNNHLTESLSGLSVNDDNPHYSKEEGGLITPETLTSQPEASQSNQ